MVDSQMSHDLYTSCLIYLEKVRGMKERPYKGRRVRSVSRGAVRSAVSSCAVMRMVAGSRPILVIA